ncbi:MAG: MobA/MobL family protein, partial [Nitrososphaerota archaeon]|nr:MobA/MobL family protein [Nitrososphaerota archaeon]
MIYYFDGNIIGRSSGRSSVGAAAYRAGEKLRSNPVGSAAYMSGEKLRDENGEIVHDYTRKTGVRHSEIMLPKNAPPEYKDRQTLWNTVEASERRKDAQLAKEIVIALQREFELKEQIAILREYIRENFTDKGMVADFSIHDKKDGNPHAHIMLTTRTVTPDGFGGKNRDWNKKDLFLEWRESWADVNNRMFERKELDERIDHRSYKSCGIDKEPMVHLGYEAAALERKGIKTEKGNHNREVQRRNAERV